MDLEIIRKYKINFQTKLLDGIIDNADPVSITGILLRADAEDLLSIINDVINDVVNEIEFSTEICEVSIYKDISIF